MTTRHKQRLAFVILLVTAFTTATALVLYSFEQNLLYFYTPSQVAAGENPDSRSFNLGGMVVAGSVRQEDTRLHFQLTDTAATVSLVYEGLVPDLFREGQGIVATGSVNEAGVFVAERVLAKHDENYMPPEVASTLQNMQPLGIGMPHPETQ